jgi:hypothetical protein
MEIQSQVISLVQDLYNSDGCVRAIFDLFASRERDPRNSTTILKNIRHDLEGRFSIEVLQVAFGELENRNCGKFHKGRPLKKGWFEWFMSPREIAEQVVSRGDTANNGDSATVASGNVPMEIFPFPVRPGITLPVAIRCDMTAGELTNLSDFIKVIAASRGNGGAGKKEHS